MATGGGARRRVTVPGSSACGRRGGTENMAASPTGRGTGSELAGGRAGAGQPVRGSADLRVAAGGPPGGARGKAADRGARGSRRPRGRMLAEFVGQQGGKGCGWLSLQGCRGSVQWRQGQRRGGVWRSGGGDFIFIFETATNNWYQRQI